MSEWQPIDTAPRDGTFFLGFVPKQQAPDGAAYVVMRWWDGAEAELYGEPCPDGDWHYGSEGACDINGKCLVKAWLPIKLHPEGPAPSTALETWGAGRNSDILDISLSAFASMHYDELSKVRGAWAIFYGLGGTIRNLIGIDRRRLIQLENVGKKKLAAWDQVLGKYGLGLHQEELDSHSPSG